MRLTIKTSIFATHYWGSAPSHRAYLALPHAHNFKIEVDLLVNNQDREIEFHDAKENLDQVIHHILNSLEQAGTNAGGIPTFSGLSCEAIGLMVWSLMLNYYTTVVEVRVSEDGDYTATIDQASMNDFMVSGGRLEFESSQLTTNGKTLMVVPNKFAKDYSLSVRPPIVTICGSTKFQSETLQAIAMMEHRKHMCLSVGYFAHAEAIVLEEQEKIELDELHKWKIMLSDYIYVVNPGGYIGSSTRSEIEFAHAHNIPVEYLVAPEGDEKAELVAQAVATLTPANLLLREQCLYYAEPLLGESRTDPIMLSVEAPRLVDLDL